MKSLIQTRCPRLAFSAMAGVILLVRWMRESERKDPVNPTTTPVAES